jgi:hypothetical protein
MRAETTGERRRLDTTERISQQLDQRGFPRTGIAEDDQMPALLQCVRLSGT